MTSYFSIFITGAGTLWMRARPSYCCSILCWSYINRGLCN